MAVKKPVHPGAIVREDCLKPFALSISEGARRLGVGRQTLSYLVNEKASVSIEMAYRLSKAFGSTPETWLGMQFAFDLAQSRQLEQQNNVERIVGAVAEQLAESDSHLDRDRLFLVQNIVERLPGDSKGGHHCKMRAEP